MNVRFALRRAGRGAGRRAGPWAALALILVLGACVSLQRGGLYPMGADQVFVSYFSNDTFYRDVEFELTEALVSEILSSPGLKLSKKEDAEVHLNGRVVDVYERVLTEDPTRTSLSNSTRVTVVVEVTDARTGEVIRRQRLSQYGQFVPSRGETLATGRAEAFRFLARDILRLLETDF